MFTFTFLPFTTQWHNYGMQTEALPLPPGISPDRGGSPLVASFETVS